MKQVFVMSRTGADVPMSDKDISLEEVGLLQRGGSAAEGWVCCGGVGLLRRGGSAAEGCVCCRGVGLLRRGGSAAEGCVCCRGVGLLQRFVLAREGVCLFRNGCAYCWLLHVSLPSSNGQGTCHLSAPGDGE